MRDVSAIFTAVSSRIRGHAAETSQEKKDEEDDEQVRRLTLLVSIDEEMGAKQAGEGHHLEHAINDLGMQVQLPSHKMLTPPHPTTSPTPPHPTPTPPCPIPPTQSHPHSPVPPHPTPSPPLYPSTPVLPYRCGSLPSRFSLR